MTAIIIALGLGIAVGFFNLLPKVFYKLIDRLMGIILFFLIFILAVGIGRDAIIFEHLNTIGLAAFVLAAGSIAGSVGLLYFVQQKWFKEER